MKVRGASQLVATKGAFWRRLRLLPHGVRPGGMSGLYSAYGTSTTKPSYAAVVSRKMALASRSSERGSSE